VKTFSLSAQQDFFQKSAEKTKRLTQKLVLSKALCFSRNVIVLYNNLLSILLRAFSDLRELRGEILGSFSPHRTGRARSFYKNPKKIKKFSLPLTLS